MGDDTITGTLVSHPKVGGALLALLVLLSQAGSASAGACGGYFGP